jgi:hypothetical protein
MKFCFTLFRFLVESQGHSNKNCLLPGIELEIKSKDKKASWVEYPTEADGGNHSKTRTSSRIKQHSLESRFTDCIIWNF